MRNKTHQKWFFNKYYLSLKEKENLRWFQTSLVHGTKLSEAIIRAFQADGLVTGALTHLNLV